MSIENADLLEIHRVEPRFPFLSTLRFVDPEGETFEALSRGIFVDEMWWGLSFPEVVKHVEGSGGTLYIPMENEP